MAEVASLKAQSRKSGPLFSEQAVDPLLKFMTTVADPDEALRKAGVTRTSLRVCLSDADVTAAFDTRKEALLGMPWRLEGPQSKALDWVWMELEAKIEPMLRCSFNALPFGYSVGELVFEVKAGGVGIKSFAEKPFEWFAPQQDGSLLYKPFDNPSGIPTEPQKYLLTVRESSYRNPYGEALLSRLYWPWFFRAQGWRFWAKWLERFGTPLLIGKTSGDAQVMAEALSRAVQDAAVAVGADDNVDLAEQRGGAGHFEGFDKAIVSLYNRLILGQTLTSDVGQNGAGSRALGQVHNEVRLDRRNADIRLATRGIQGVVNTLWTLNGFAGLPPEFCLQDDTGLEAERAERDAKLVEAGIVELSEDYILRVYDYEKGDIKVPEKKAAGTPPAAGAAPEPPPTKAAAGPRFTPEQQVVEDEVSHVLRNAASPIDPEAIRAAIREAATPEDLAMRLAVLWGDADTSGFQMLLARAMFAADVTGYVHAGGARDAGPDVAAIAQAVANAMPKDLKLEAPITVQPPAAPEVKLDVHLPERKTPAFDIERLEGGKLRVTPVKEG